MVRKQQSHEANEEIVKNRLKPAYGKTGANPYVVYADLKKSTDEVSRVLVLNFAAEYAAHYFIMQLIGSDDWEEVDPIGTRQCILTSSGVRISMFKDDLIPLINYKPYGREAQWESSEIKRSVSMFKYGQGERIKKSYDTEYGTDEDEVSGEDSSNRISKRKEPRAVKATKVKHDTSGHTSANDIAKELGVEGREVRGVLRSLKLEKPAWGWSWPKGEAEKIKSQIIKGLKKK